VDERSRVAVSAVIGAVGGALFGYLYLTEAGRRVRAEIEPRIDDFVTEVRALRGTVEKARSAAQEGWQSLTDAAGGNAAPWQQGSGTRTSH
jgi:hypothetical protein